MDNAGRDIRDRLRWQYELHTQLAENFPLPKIIDYFEAEEESYLVMEFISGVSLASHLEKEYKDRIWNELPSFTQLELINHLLGILNIIQNLHDSGYIHRDITPGNFMLDKNNKIWLIDVELMWAKESNNSGLPFGLGTPGFTSPEQLRGEIPTEKEDIYAVGALMIAFFTNLMPTKFRHRSNVSLQENIHFFVQNEKVAKVINDCMNPNPSKRPHLYSIEKVLKAFLKELQQRPTNTPVPSAKANRFLSLQEMEHFTQCALNGLGSPSVLSPDSRWISRMPSESEVVGNEQLGMTVTEGWYMGVTGPLWLLALAKRVGFNVDDCLEAYKKNWSHIEKVAFSKPNFNTTLYEGTAGVAMALSEGLASGLLQTDDHNLKYLAQCYNKENTFLTLAEGVAGKGLSLLFTSHYIEASYKDNLLSVYINTLLETQQLDGSWPLNKLAGKPNQNVYGLNHGNAGIIWFLLVYLQKYSDPRVQNAITNALNWMIKKASTRKGIYSWPVSKNISAWNAEKGNLGIALVLIKAYQILKRDAYKKVAENILTNIPRHPVITNFTLGSGLAGLGEVYLDAYKAFNDPLWQNSAQWIANQLIHTSLIDNQGRINWLPDHQSEETADLFMGTSGIIHFMMRFALSNKIAHPLDPFQL